jgi:hypothetical protein
MHGPRSIKHGWEWHEICFFTRWLTSNNATILCFDVPEKLRTSIELALSSSTEGIEFSDPYSVPLILVDEIINLYDDSVWSLRNHISAREAVGLSYH